MNMYELIGRILTTLFLIALVSSPVISLVTAMVLLHNTIVYSPAHPFLAYTFATILPTTLYAIFKVIERAFRRK